MKKRQSQGRAQVTTGLGGVITQQPRFTDEVTGLRSLINELKATQQEAEGTRTQGCLAPDSNLLLTPFLFFPPFLVHSY